MPGFSGSSPLARGLRDRASSTYSSRRIIPARAGFTCRATCDVHEHGDHPRSRGVYPASRSPTHALPGIIPARAGFTQSPGKGPTIWRDHPRSRGVYTTGQKPSVGLDGSSPLARGLPEEEARAVATARIIPARAGFTTDGSPEVRDSPDHPRSRGVYAIRTPSEMMMLGSSPLARGLPRMSQAASGATGIIPARAGFTEGHDGLRARSRDHPRSRGVYHSSLSIAMCTAGSSPLARGLPDNSDRRRDGARIIPARAGFTVLFG